MKTDHLILLVTGAALASIGIASMIIWLAVMFGWMR
jgi:hypothetical protein